MNTDTMDAEAMETKTPESPVNRLEDRKASIQESSTQNSSAQRNFAESDRGANDSAVHDEKLNEFLDKMRAAGMSDLVLRTFSYHYRRLIGGDTGYITSQEAQPVASIAVHHELDEDAASVGERALDQVVVIKLNGGLGTSMGMLGPKSLVRAKNGLTFFDIIVHQIQHLRAQYGARVPLVLMDSFNTAAAMREAVAHYPDFEQDLPMQFIQNMIPKVGAEDLRPVSWSQDPEKEWCPPGHGDLYSSLYDCGLLDEMIEAGYEYAFVSNSDNLGAVVDVQILGYFIANQLPFLMEVAERTAADAKGGHLAQRPDGSLILREIAQCPPDEISMFQDVGHYGFFNTNNLWLHLPTVREALRSHEGVLPLALIRNQKNIDPTLPDSPLVYQLETAMGSAIGVFPNASALCVSRSRFIPIKRTNDLLALWSDAYVMADDYRIRVAPERVPQFGLRPPLVTLDDKYYKLIEDLRTRFPNGAPSLVNCNSLVVEGDVYFGRDVAIEGEVCIVNSEPDAKVIPDHSVLRGIVHV